MKPSEAEIKKKRRQLRLRGTYHIIWGVLYLILPVVLFYMQTMDKLQINSGLAVVICILMFLYGIFRIWRGSKDLSIAKSFVS